MIQKGEEHEEWCPHCFENRTLKVIDTQGKLYGALHEPAIIIWQCQTCGGQSFTIRLEVTSDDAISGS